MPRRLSFPPYLTLPESSVVALPADGWELLRDGHEPVVLPSGQPFPSWDSGLNFALRRHFTFTEGLSHRVAMDNSDASFRLITRLITAKGARSTVVHHQLIDLAKLQPIEVVVTPDSTRIAIDIALTSWVVVDEVGGTFGPLAPPVRGARIWEDTWTSKLEGGKTRLPIEVASFSQTFPAWSISNALFHVDVAEYPDLDFEQAVCVYLNSDFPAFVYAIESGSAAETAMLWDAVTRRIVSVALSDAYIQADPWPEGSLGAQTDSWLTSIFGGEKRESISALRTEDPSRFEARIQSWARIATQLAGSQSQ